MTTNDTCRGCGEEIDTEICLCGEPTDTHSPYGDHEPTPGGCNCRYYDDNGPDVATFMERTLDDVEIRDR